MEEKGADVSWARLRFEMQEKILISRVEKMKIIGILEIILGVIGILMGFMMFGDIGVACIVGALAALLSGIGFIIASKNRAVSL